MKTGRDGAADQSVVQSTTFTEPAGVGSPLTTLAALAGAGSPSHLRGAMRLYARTCHEFWWVVKGGNPRDEARFSAAQCGARLMYVSRALFKPLLSSQTGRELPSRQTP